MIRWTLSGRWGITGKRIIEDFITTIPHRLALKCFELSVFFNADNSDSWHNLGWEYFYNGKYDQAKEAFEKNLEIEKEKNTKKNSHLSKIGIGKVYEARENAILAATCFKEGADLCIQFYAESDPQKVVECLMKTADSLKNLRFLNVPVEKEIEFLEDALRLYEKAIKVSVNINPTNSRTALLQEEMRLFKKQIEWRKKGKMCPKLSLNNILEKPLIELLSIESKPERLDTLYDKEYAFAKLGKYDKTSYGKAVEYADKILGQEPKNVFAWINKAQNLGNLGRYKEALECSKKALELNDKNALACYNKGFYLFRLGDRENNIIKIKEAIEYFDKSLKLDLNYPPSWYNKGYALHKLGGKDNEEEAVRCYDKALDLEPDNKFTLDNKGYSLIILNRYEEAIKCFDKALEIDQNFIKPWNIKGRALGKLGKYEDALKCLNKALDLALELGLDKEDPNYVASVLDNKGYVLNELDQYEEAIKCFDKALGIDPKYSSAWQNKIYASLQLNRINKVPGESFFTTPLNIFKDAICEVKNRVEFIHKVRNSIIHWFKDAIFRDYISSKEKLTSLLNEFDKTFEGSVKAISPDEIKKVCNLSVKYPENNKKVKRVFGWV